jgi:hypothetical protein
MKTPKSIEPLVRDGLVDEVLRPLKSGKEAAVYVYSPKARYVALKSIKMLINAVSTSRPSTRKGAR